jgi:hypothetical protein
MVFNRSMTRMIRQLVENLVTGEQSRRERAWRSPLGRTAAPTAIKRKRPFYGGCVRCRQYCRACCLRQLSRASVQVQSAVPCALQFGVSSRQSKRRSPPSRSRLQLVSGSDIFKQRVLRIISTLSDALPFRHSHARIVRGDHLSS